MGLTETKLNQLVDIATHTNGFPSAATERLKAWLWSERVG